MQTVNIFPDWDEATTAFYANLDGEKDPKITEAFEDRLYASGFHVPLDADGRPRCANDPKLGVLMTVYSTRSEMLKAHKPGSRSEFWPLPTIAMALEHYNKLAGLCVNLHGVRLLVMRWQLDKITTRIGGSSGSGINPRKTHTTVEKPLFPPPYGLGPVVAYALRGGYDVRSVYYMSSSIDDGKTSVPFIAADFDGPTEPVYAAIAGAFTQVVGNDAKVIVAKAGGEDLDLARALGRLLYSRAGDYVCP
jgi:hypothetical protein